MIISTKKVLLAEHKSDIADILIYLLRAWDYETICAKDGEDVLELVRREQPDIIILDSNLPKIDGLKVSKLLKEDFLTAHIPVIILIDKRQIRKKMLEIEQGVDDYIVNPPDPIDLEVRMEMALRRTQYQLQANALTKLPGNRQIEKIIQSKINEGQPFSVAYYDIDNFKSYNDKYGYIKGDNVIKQTAYIISIAVKRYGNKTDFVGHIGGDDFVVVTTPDKDRLIASETILSFNRLVQFHYDTKDRKRGYIISRDRRGNLLKVPLMSISIAIVNNKEHRLENMVELMEIISEIKSYLKTLPGSNFLVNRRSPAKKEFIDEKSDISSKKEDVLVSNYRPLGQILLEGNVITPQQLEIALNKHWSSGQRLGQTLIGLGMASSGDIARALESQLNIPHFDVKKIHNNEELENLLRQIPFEIIKDHGAIPLNRDKDVLSVAMLNPGDVDTIQKIKNITHCKIAPFFILENEFGEILEKITKKADKGF